MSDPTFNINRRIALQTMATAGAAMSVSLGSLGSSTAMAQVTPKSVISNSDSNSSNQVKAPSGPRFNLDEAHRVMKNLDLDALVLGDGRSFQQATGFIPVIAKMGWPIVNLAILVRDPEPHILIVMFGFSYYYMAADLHPFTDNQVFLYAGPGSSELEQKAALDSVRFVDRGETDLDSIELNRVKMSEQTLEKHTLNDSMGDALFAALKSANVTKGRLAFDHPSLEQTLKQVVPDADLTSSDDAIRRIRSIKSDVEIALMRASSAINIDAAHAAVKQIDAGASYKDLRRLFYSELAARGAHGVFMVVDHVTDEQYDAELKTGQAFVIDCVGDYQGYLGDYGRTVFLGDVSKSAERAQVTVGKAWDSLRAKLKPGLKFSDISALGQKAMSEQGTTYRVPFNPHSVGVFHSDHFGNGTSGPREDIVLRPGMIISVDCPVMETGIGGSVHLEDLMLITHDGAEPLHDVGNQAIYI